MAPTLTPGNRMVVQAAVRALSPNNREMFTENASGRGSFIFVAAIGTCPIVRVRETPFGAFYITNSTFCGLFFQGAYHLPPPSHPLLSKRYGSPPPGPGCCLSKFGSPFRIHLHFSAAVCNNAET